MAENKKTILYVIDSLGRGGAELLLVGTLQETLKVYNIVLVALSDVNELSADLPAAVHYHSLSFKTKLDYPACILGLRKLIKKYKPSFLHAHLLNSSIIARIAAPKQLPLIISIHSILSKTAFNSSRIYSFLEKRLFNKKHLVLAVSQPVLNDYIEHIDKPGRSIILSNYIDDSFSVKPSLDTKGNLLRMVAVGNVKEVKNYEYLLQGFKMLDRSQFSLDIFGKIDPIVGDNLRKMITQHNLPVRLMGASTDIATILQGYDAFVMPSKHEGFGIAAIEAMACGLPLLLSDIPVLRAVTFDNALFFSLDDPAHFAHQATQLKSHESDSKEMIEKGLRIVEEHYSKQRYMDRLLKIYSELSTTNA